MGDIGCLHSDRYKFRLDAEAFAEGAVSSEGGTQEQSEMSEHEGDNHGIGSRI